jgi:pentatricopeptide repeat domain-containing protein 1
MEESLSIHKEMQNAGLVEDAFTLTALLTACERTQDWKLALEFFQNLQGRGVRPNTVAFNQLIAVLGSSQQWRLAVEVAEALSEKGVPKDIVTYGSLISAIERAGQWQEALDVYDRMLEEDLKPNVYIFASVLNACERGRKWDRATELFQAMQAAVDDAPLPLSTVGVLARRAMYASPALLSKMPAPLVTAAQAAMDTGRAARRWIDRSNVKDDASVAATKAEQR